MKKNKDKAGFGNYLRISTLRENSLNESPIKNKFNKTFDNKMLVSLFALILFSLMLSTSAFAAKDFIVENKTSALFIINGTTGNIVLTPSFGMVGIGTINPINALTVIGSVSAFGSLNATFINATEIRIGNNLIGTSGAFNNANYTTLEDVAFRISNFTAQLNNYIPSFFNNENFTNLKPFTLTNYSAEYALSGFKLINFTSNYDARADRFGNVNYTSLENAAFTNTNASNLNTSLWNLSRNLILYPKDAAFLVRIGDVNRNISNDTFAVIGSAAVYGSLNATSFNATTILQAGNQVQTINAVFNNVNYTSLENAAFTNTNYTNLEAAAFNKANYSSEYASTGFKNANYTALENAAFTNANYTGLEASAFTNVNYSALNTTQWNASGNNIYQKNFAGSIGIGLTAPSALLHVQTGPLSTSDELYADTLNNNSLAVIRIGSQLAATNRLLYMAVYGQNATGTGNLGQQAGNSSEIWSGADVTNGLHAGTTANAPFALYSNSAERMRITGAGNVGIGTTSPQNKLEVIGAITLAGGVNASSLNVTGFSITDDSLVTLADGSKKKIKDIKAGDYALTLDETTGKLVPRKVNALLDHGIRPIYEMTTEDGRAINTTAEHPYYVKSFLPDKILNASEGVITLSGNAFFNPLSPENIGQLKARDKATYGASLSCGANCLASGKNCRNSSAEIKVISSSKNSGAMNSNLFDMAFSENTEEGTPLIIREEITTFASTTNFSGIIYPLLLESSLSYLFANDSLTSPASSWACSSLNFDLDTIFLNLITFKSLSFNTLFTSMDNSSFGIALNSDSNSSGILIINSAISTSPKTLNEDGYLKLFNDAGLGRWLEVRYLKAGDYIAVPDYLTGAIKWVKISSIKTLEPQHVYDLAIEGTRNFIANDIVAHNTYLATSSGNVGINTTAPAQTLTVQGTLNVTPAGQNATFVITPSGNIGIGNSTPQDVMTIDLTDTGKNITFNMAGGSKFRMLNNGGGGSMRLEGSVALVLRSLTSSINFQNGSGTALAQIAGVAGQSTYFNANGVGTGLFGLNTTTPAETLDVIGTLSVKSGQAGNAQGLYQNSAGNVGIGTTAPLSLLHINDSSASGALRVTNVSGTTLFFVNGSSGNVGIGTTGPTTKLDVNTGRINVAGTGAMYQHSLAGTIAYRLTSAGANYGTIQNEAANIWSLGYSGTDSNALGTAVVTWNSAGNVGIGTTTPDAKLSINGGSNGEVLRISGTSDPSLYINATGTSNYQWRIANQNTVRGDLIVIDVNNSNAVPLRIQAGTPSSTLVLNNSGFVGIGASTPKITLSVQTPSSGDSNGLALGLIGRSSGGNENWIRFLQNNGATVQGGVYGHNTLGLVLAGPSATNDVIIDAKGNVGIGAGNVSNKLDVTGNFSTTTGALLATSSGNVGIGTAGPGAKLEIQSSLAAAVQDFEGLRIFNGYDATAATLATSAQLTLGIQNSVGASYTKIAAVEEAADAYAALVFYTKAGTGSPTERMRISTSGNVGIGTTAPAYTLHVEGSIGRNSTDRLLIQGGNGGSNDYSQDTLLDLSASSINPNAPSHGGLARVAGINLSHVDEAGNAASGYISFSTSSGNNLAANWGERMRIDKSGNVGIGTTGPGTLLDVYSTSNAIPITSQIVAAAAGSVQDLLTLNRKASGGTLATGFGVGQAFKFSREDSGGTGEKGRINVSFQPWTSSTNWETRMDFALSRYSGSETTGNNIMSLQSNGNVGIGTTVPGQKLTVVGDANISGSLNVSSGLNVISGNVGIGTTGPASLLDISSATVPVLSLSSTVGGVNQLINFRAASHTQPIQAQIAGVDDGAYSDHITFSTKAGSSGGALSEKVRIQSSGNVGIGTTGPASTLTIVGNFSATGTKSAVVNTSYGMRKLYAMESPDIRFYDQGRASLTNGIANISLDPIFIETVEPDFEIYLTPKADTAGIYVAEKAKEYFIVKGRNKNSNIPFSWLLSALRKGYSATRLDSERKENTEIIAVIDEENKVTDVNIINNFNNIQNVNASGENQTESSNAITGNAINEITKSNNEKSAIENKFAVASDKEDEIINKISEKTNLDKEAIKKSITFKRKEPKKEKFEEENPTPELPHDLKNLSQIAQKISIINGSIVLRLG